ncbi:type I glyceraldehyde-3-phosphate dehydrogenase [Thermodesulforhabdus norvegica]|uniref:Glyceraldehyde 3-phosphate dehydrogenase n=1 Tax=Thermodesulforhabdus norvegica TaxID=39841 RepID=A0A1I4VJR7_9BACT|nr:glyceraldehyde 3-phosphate dehydrogenase NAD-binding domain-containing protein [Thermodesulforhabdus norvegica]SFN01340.1 glyceraldehyde 3-phosphate dehydrogenase [Thermodesulforhabdus norvegica]
MGGEDKFVPQKLGINGLGRIGKLTLWHHAERQYFSELVVNIGRQAGTGLEDIAHFIEKDSTYGALHTFLYGCRANRVIEEINDREGTMRVNGVKVKILRQHRNPADIGWKDHGVELVVDCTGAFLDPTVPENDSKGSVRGHLAAGARKVIVSAPFKIKDKSKSIPEDSITCVKGINDSAYDPKKHVIISAASCTTTCLAYMMKPLLDYFGPQRILSASMATVHAQTPSQPVLDRLPKAGATDLRKNRAVANNIILTTTGAAKALALVIPEMKNIGFIAESVRVPITTGSLIILVVLIQDESFSNPVNRELINSIYRDAAKNYPEGYLIYSEEQNVSSDIIGVPRAAAIIEAHETHTRTAAVRFDLQQVVKAIASAPINSSGESVSAESLKKALLSLQDAGHSVLQIPVTQAVIYGWYDNELGSYTNMLGDLTVSIAKSLD